ncbi:cytokine receptor common subunit gamma-like [Nematolebias whitei]|uniref:cytokine receptor common subunit gamma-like n=1 Tax=Nematolebias whitei TaxID=451745 RepID=UPI001898EF73|nr:cytokine receptor common subunit gamma-like [Nematolebias whitei]
MLTRLLLLLCLVGQTVAKKPPDVECQVVNLEYVQCSWNKDGTPEVNYTFSSWVHYQKETNCSKYLLENDTNVGCIQAYVVKLRFMTFYTVLKHGSEMAQMKHQLKNRVKLNPPTNVTVQNGSDFNLWFYWNQTATCVEREVRYRINNNKWEHTIVPDDSYYINFPSSSARYELQVRSKMAEMCGGSIFWSDWSEPVVWGFNKSTNSISVWTPVLYAVGAITLILLVLMLLQHERTGQLKEKQQVHKDQKDPPSADCVPSKNF